MATIKNFFATRWGIISVGAFIGVFAALLQKWGNPANMGICVACFDRDIAGALGLHRAAIVLATSGSRLAQATPWLVGMRYF